MPYRNMSLEDFASYVGMDARDVRKLAERGKLPGQKIGGDWRFNRARVTEWLQQEMHTLDEERLVTLERTLGAGVEEADLLLTSLIGVEGIDVALAANTKASVLRELVGLAERTGLLYDKDGLLDALEEREAMCSTGLKYEVAIPHPRQPMPYATAEPMVCVARLTRGIGFGSPYGGLSRLFFLIACHEDRHHLRVLARLMRVLDETTMNELMLAEDREALLKVLIDKESQVAKAAASG